MLWLVMQNNYEEIKKQISAQGKDLVTVNYRSCLKSKASTNSTNSLTIFS